MALTAVGISSLMWFTGISLATTGHTRLLHTTAKAVRAVDRFGSLFRGEIHRALGDRNYVHASDSGDDST
jgi:hypothetical protein